MPCKTVRRTVCPGALLCPAGAVLAQEKEEGVLAHRHTPPEESHATRGVSWSSSRHRDQVIEAANRVEHVDCLLALPGSSPSSPGLRKQKGGARVREEARRAVTPWVTIFGGSSIAQSVVRVASSHQLPLTL